MANFALVYSRSKNSRVVHSGQLGQSCFLKVRTIVIQSTLSFNLETSEGYVGEFEN